MQHRAFALVGFSLLTLGTAHAGYVFQNIVDPSNPTYTKALGINNSSTISGYGDGASPRGFVLGLPASFTNQSFPGTTSTRVAGISGTGATVGSYLDVGGKTHGFSNIGGTFTTVDSPASPFTRLLGINRSATTAVGYVSTDASGATAQQAMSYSFLTTAFTTIAGLPVNNNSQATGVNDAGTIVGFYQSNGAFSAFTDILGTITSLSAPGALSTQALGINNLGQIVGDYLDSSGAMHGFIDDAGVFTTIDVAGAAGTAVNGINDQGQIVGFFVQAGTLTAVGDTIGFVGTPTSPPGSVPEPSSALLAYAGLAAAWTALKRRPQA